SITRVPYTLLRVSGIAVSLYPPAPTPSYTLSLHDALPIYIHRQPGGTTHQRRHHDGSDPVLPVADIPCRHNPRYGTGNAGNQRRSEEHTSELQSRENLVCRPLREKKKSCLIALARAVTPT